MVVALVVQQVLERTGPFIIPVVLFAFGVAGYGLLYLYSQWRADDPADSP